MNRCDKKRFFSPCYSLYFLRSADTIFFCANTISLFHFHRYASFFPFAYALQAALHTKIAPFIANPMWDVFEEAKNNESCKVLHNFIVFKPKPKHNQYSHHHHHHQQQQQHRKKKKNVNLSKLETNNDEVILFVGFPSFSFPRFRTMFVCTRKWDLICNNIHAFFH